jgi:histidyl-tRNA synthetase
VRAALDQAPTIGASLCEACVDHFAVVRSLLDAVGVAYDLVPTLVRGLDYYSRTTWEFVGPMENENSTISGGGRYDYLVEEIGGPPTPGVGFGAGLERLILALEEAGVEPNPTASDVFLLIEPEARDNRLPFVARQLRDLRASGVAADVDYAGRSRKGQLTQASRLGARLIVEIDADSATIQGDRVADADLVAEIVSRLER